MILAQATPAAIDEAWAQVWAEAARLNEQILSLIKRRARYGLKVPTWLAEEIQRLVAKRDEAKAQAQEAEQEFRAEWDRRGGWTRYRVVVGGHCHRFEGCRSIRWTTYTLWDPQYSGMSEQALVATLGEGACTHCFPEAPVAPRRGEGEVKPGECPGSRQPPKEARPGKRWQPCRACGSYYSINRAGLVRAHKHKEVDR